MKHSNIEGPSTIRLLLEVDAKQVEALDALSGKNYAEWIEARLIHGVFSRGKLIAYAMLGPAFKILKGTPENYDYLIDEGDYYLDHVFVLEEFRGLGAARELVKRAILESNGGVATLTESADEAFVEKMGFVPLDDGVYFWGETI